MVREILKCEFCEFQTHNKKSYSNHTRYGCNSQKKYTNIDCKHCGSKLEKRKPSEQGLFCDRTCYVSWIRETNAFSGKNAHRYKTGESRTRIYSIWLSMKSRCQKPQNKDYKNYGGRGISVCEDWFDFLTFKSWAYSNGYTNELSIERIDVNGGYNPENCTWIEFSEQAKNKRNSLKNKKNETKRDNFQG